MLQRRTLLGGLVGLLATPAIVPANRLMRLPAPRLLRVPRFELLGNPEGFTIDPVTGVITTTTALKPGQVVLTIRDNDLYGESLRPGEWGTRPVQLIIEAKPERLWLPPPG